MINKFKDFVWFLIGIIIFVACSNTETIIKPKEVEITIPAVTVKTDSVKEIPSDSFILNYQGILDSSMYEATFDIPNAKEKATVKVYPKSKKATLIIPEQKGKTVIQDTIKNVIKKETTTAEKFGYATYGIIAFIIIVVAGVAIYILKFRRV